MTIFPIKLIRDVPQILRLTCERTQEWGLAVVHGYDEGKRIADLYDYFYDAMSAGHEVVYSMMRDQNFKIAGKTARSKANPTCF